MVSNQSINFTENFKISQVSTIYDITLTTGCQSNNNSDTLTTDGQSKSTYASYCVNNNFKAFWKNSKYDDILSEFILD